MEVHVKIIFKKLKSKSILLFIASLFLAQFVFSANDQFVRFVNDNTNFFNTRLNFQIPSNKTCQTITYLNHPNLRQNIEDNYSYKINLIGKEFFENLINTVIEKELEFKESHYVFYHGKQLEFLLFDDLLDALNKIIFKKSVKNFFMLRIPDKDHKKFKTISEFLKYYMENGLIYDWDFDHKSQIQKLLLSVNPSLFGNNYNSGECTFYYFLNSTNANSLNIKNLIKNIFEFFKVEYLYKKYEDKISNLLQLLSTSDPKKTGILLQIFVPKNITDEVAYRCIPWGNLYYTDPQFHPASVDADKYQNNTFSYSELLSNTLDEIQFRLLINEKLLDPNSKIRMFRYYNETNYVKQYEKELTLLINQINQDILANDKYKKK